MNDKIIAREVRLIDSEGENVGVVSIEDALERAQTVGLDLVEISPDAKPPVCKIIDYGKYKYEAQKKLAAIRKKQKVIEIKEVKVRPTIEENDYQVKMRNMRRFLGDKNKVKVSLRFRGREITHQQLGKAVLERIAADLDDIAQIEYAPKLENRQMIMILAPRAP